MSRGHTESCGGESAAEREKAEGTREDEERRRRTKKATDLLFSLSLSLSLSLFSSQSTTAAEEERADAQAQAALPGPCAVLSLGLENDDALRCCFVSLRPFVSPSLSLFFSPSLHLRALQPALTLVPLLSCPLSQPSSASLSSLALSPPPSMCVCLGAYRFPVGQLRRQDVRVEVDLGHAALRLLAGGLGHCDRKRG